jgi:hypothetical protein
MLQGCKFFCKEPQTLFLNDQQDARVKICVSVIPNRLNFNALHRIGFVVQIQYYYVTISALIRKIFLLLKVLFVKHRNNYFTYNTNTSVRDLSLIFWNESFIFYSICIYIAIMAAGCVKQHGGLRVVRFRYT